MKIEITTGQITGSNSHKWWAELSGTKTNGELVSFGLCLSGSTEEEAVRGLVDILFGSPTGEYKLVGEYELPETD